jgi:hypothetical protein
MEWDSAQTLCRALLLADPWMCTGALASVQDSCCCSELAHSFIHSAHACTEQKYVRCWFSALPCCSLFALRV